MRPSNIIVSMDWFSDLFTSAALTAFLQVVFIDLVLAGDNAVVIGMAAAGLPPEKRKLAILYGILAATVLRILFALLATELLTVVGLLFAGGVLLLWVGWKMWRELRSSREAHAPAGGDPHDRAPPPAKTLRQAATQIVLADLSMSIDNVLGVAGAAHAHPEVLIFGLGLSVVLMGVAASAIAGLLERYRWIAYVGLAMIVYVALRMVWEGGHDICSQGLPMIGVQPPSYCHARLPT